MQRDTDLEATLVAKYVVMAPLLNERTRRLWAAAESIAIGFGGDAIVSSATGLARQTIRNGRHELAQGVTTDPHPPARGGASRHRGHATGDHRGAGPAGRTADARRPDVAAAVDVQERREAGRRADRAGLAGERDDGREAVGRARLSSARAAEGARRRGAPGSQRAVRAHQRDRRGVHRDAGNR